MHKQEGMPVSGFVHTAGHSLAAARSRRHHAGPGSAAHVQLVFVEFPFQVSYQGIDTFL